MEPFWMVSEIKEKLCTGESTFSPFYRKGLIGVWYYTLRNPVKATSLGHPRDDQERCGVFFFLRLIGPRSFQCFNRQASNDHLCTEARRLEGAGPI
jgi:hypothetical protein